jgi:hypothetical protein
MLIDLLLILSPDLGIFYRKNVHIRSCSFCPPAEHWILTIHLIDAR